MCSHQEMSMECSFSESKSIISKALRWVDLSLILGAEPFWYASSHRLAHKHHESPGLRPLNPNSSDGFLKTEKDPKFKPADSVFGY